MPAYKQFMALGSDVLNEGGGIVPIDAPRASTHPTFGASYGLLISIIGA